MDKVGYGGVLRQDTVGYGRVHYDMLYYRALRYVTGMLGVVLPQHHSANAAIPVLPFPTAMYPCIPVRCIPCIIYAPYPTLYTLYSILSALCMLYPMCTLRFTLYAVQAG